MSSNAAPRRLTPRRLLLLLLLLGAACVPPMLGTTGRAPAVTIAGTPGPAGHSTRLRVMTLNLAHGRADGVHQALQSTGRIEANLSAAAAVLAREAPDVVALQEADGPSSWSGRFDHVAWLARRARYPQGVRGEHVSGAGVRYGTAVISRLPLGEAFSETFAPTPPTFRKGFVLTTVNHSRMGPVDVVSVHLDFARAGARADQVARIARALRDRPHPRVVLGDFNADWDEAGTVPALAQALDLRAWRPEGGAATFPAFESRIDWILYSPSLRPVRYQVLPDTISDHRAVLAEFAPSEDEIDEDLPPPGR